MPFLLALIAAVFLSAAPSAQAFEYVPGEVVVDYKDSEGPQVVQVDSVSQSVKELKNDPSVNYAVPNVVARAASSFTPRDPGFSQQWNFTGRFGVGALGAWRNLIAAGRPGGRGVVVAVVDTGVAYANRPGYRRSPDFAAGQFVRGYDFSDNDRFPSDDSGHGTHVAGTIAEATDNNIGAAGLAYGVKVMPVKVLDSEGAGDAEGVAQGIRFAARRGADIINLSLEFGSGVGAAQVPQVISALAYARRKGSLVVAAAGNSSSSEVAYPAKVPSVLSVGSTTDSGCLSDFSNQGADLVAPGGGINSSKADCAEEAENTDIYQFTFFGLSPKRFGMPRGYEGTSMATPHVSAAAALVIASGVLGSDPSPAKIEAHLQNTARDLGPEGADRLYGFGLLDAEQATAP